MKTKKKKPVSKFRCPCCDKMRVKNKLDSYIPHEIQLVDFLRVFNGYTSTLDFMKDGDQILICANCAYTKDDLKRIRKAK